MNRRLLVIALVLIACGTVVATGAFPSDGNRDRIDPENETGIFLSPADTPNGDRYARIDERGELNITLDTIAGTTVTIDDVFVLAFEGEEGSDEARVVRIEHDNEAELTLRRMDTREPVGGPEDPITLAPNESVMFGFVVEAHSTRSTGFVETVTYRTRIPDPTPTPGPDPTPTPSPAPDPGTDPTPTPDPGTDPTPTPDPGPTPTPTPDPGTDPTPTPTPDQGAGPTPDPGTDPTPTPTPDQGDGPTPDPGTTPTPTPGSGVDDGAEPGEDPAIVPGLGGLPIGFGSFVVPWFAWLLFVGFFTVVIDYLTQTRLRDVLPLLKTPEETRRPRIRYALARLGLLWLTVLVLALAAAAALWTIGLRGAGLFLPILVGSIILGGVLGYRWLPDIEGGYVEPVADGSGENGTDD